MKRIWQCGRSSASLVDESASLSLHCGDGADRRNDPAESNQVAQASQAIRHDIVAFTVYNGDRPDSKIRKAVVARLADRNKLGG